MIEVTINQKKIAILDYIEKRYHTFFKLGFNEVDSLIFAQFAYMDFGRIVPDTAEAGGWIPMYRLFRGEEFKYMVQNTFFPLRNKRLLTGMCASPRYRDVEVNFCVNKFDKDSEEQFSAISFRLPTGEIVVAFRGTDVSIVGWKENFNMLYLAPVPSQQSAVAYLTEIAEQNPGDIYVTGHSKGGNLAVYSVLFASEEIRSRVVHIYDLDGPGFPVDVVGYQEMKEMEEKVIKLRPEGSIVGIIFESVGKVKIVKSSNSGIKQHDAYTWQIKGNQFVTGRKATVQVRHMNKTLNVLAYDLDRAQRKVVVDTVFSLLSRSKAENLFEVGPGLLKEKNAIAKTLKDMDEETANCIKAFLMSFARNSLVSVFGKDRRPQSKWVNVEEQVKQNDLRPRKKPASLKKNDEF